MSINKKKLTPIVLVSIFFLMLGLSFAAVPLYELFCRVTGFAGTTQNAKNKEIPKIVINQIYKLRFDTNVGKQLEWDFFPEKNTLELKPGEKKEFILSFFLDPKVVDDNKTKDISDVTLSYTFFSAEYYKK